MNGFLGILYLDYKRFRVHRRWLTTFVQPLLYLFVLGSGLGAATRFGTHGYMPFIFPGVVTLCLLTTAVFSGIGIVMDRQIGFMKAILVTPVSRVGVAFGKICSGALQALVVGLVILLFSPLAHVSFSPGSLALFSCVMVLSAITFSAIGVAIATQLSTFAFPVVAQGLLMPLFFLSGAMYPLGQAPEWLQILAHLDPVAYAVDLLRGSLSAQFFFPPAMSLAVLLSLIAVASSIAATSFQPSDEG
jgi:ABC-2 type transport system permease protein